MIAGMVLSNLFYVVGAIVAATLVSAFVLLRHRRPKSLEAGIEMFSRELRALQPERRGPAAGSPGPRVVPTEATRDGGLRPATRTSGQSGAGRGAGRGRGFAPTPIRQVALPARPGEGQGTLRRDPAVTRLVPTSSSSAGSTSSASAASAASDGASMGQFAVEPTNGAARPPEESGRNEARAPWPHREDEPG